MWGPNLVARELPQGAGKGDTAKARAHTVFVQFPFPEGLCLLTCCGITKEGERVSGEANYTVQCGPFISSERNSKPPFGSGLGGLITFYFPLYFTMCPEIKK